MHDDIAVVEDHPARRRSTFAPQWTSVRSVSDPVHDVVENRVDLALAVAATDNEIIGQQRDLAQVQQDDVAGLLLRGEIDDLPGEVLCLQPVRSYNPHMLFALYRATSDRTGTPRSQQVSRALKRAYGPRWRGFLTKIPVMIQDLRI
jgi:hypothetical protein